VSDKDGPGGVTDKDGPGRLPDKDTPGQKPNEETPGRTPDEGASGRTPDEEAPGRTPDEEAPGRTPDEETPDRTPDEEAPGRTPDEETPGRTPGEEAPGRTPGEETPSRTPQESRIESPRGWDKFDPQLNDDFARRLRNFRGNEDLQAPPELRGGEGQLFPSETQPGLALKRWFEKRIGDMAESIRKLEQTRNAVRNDPRLSADMDVVQVHEKGPDWIVRDFDPNSVPLKSVLGDPQVAGARQRLIQALECTTDPMLRDVLGKLRRTPPSANLHWSPETEKILIIDMQ